MRRRTTAEKVCGRKGHNHKQMRSDRDGKERRAREDGQEGSNDTSEGWSGKSAEDSAGLETEE